MEAPIGISNRHIHLSKQDLEYLFGKNYKLKVKKNLKQPGTFASQETLDLIGPNGFIKSVRIIGPSRNETQVELLSQDTEILGIEAPIKLSGKLDNTPGLILKNKNKELKIERGAIIAMLHLHLNKNNNLLKLTEKDHVDVYDKKEKLIFEKVPVRLSEGFETELHIDKEEAEKFKLKNDDILKIKKPL